MVGPARARSTRTSPTKENRKGNTRSYNINYRRRFLVILFQSAAASLLAWKIYYCTITPLSPRGGSNNNHRNNDNADTAATATGTIATRPIWNIDYSISNAGSKKTIPTPVVMIRSSLSDELLDRFLQEPLYSSSTPEASLNDPNTFPGLDNRVNKQENIYVYEGYYHSLLHKQGTVYSKNPNPLIGIDFDKPPASDFTRAFFDAFRVGNKDIFDRLKRNLFAASSFHHDIHSKSNFNSTEIQMKKGGKEEAGDENKNNQESEEEEEEEEDVCYILAKWIERGLHFGDLSIQIHYGTGNEKKLASGAAWHTDAENSLLHLAVTLTGTRVLHSFREQSPQQQQQQYSNNTTVSTGLRRRQLQRSSSNNNHENNIQHQPRQQPTKMTEVLETQTPGDIYLSSSTLMRHAPQFFNTNYLSRSIAIHARILYTSAEVAHFRKARKRKPEAWEVLTTVLADTLSRAQIRIPTLEEVESRLLSVSSFSH